MTLHNLSPRIRTILAGIALAIPFLAILTMILTSAAGLERTEYRFRIQGYDPRDILRGHYLQFQYVWQDANITGVCTSETSCCACIGGDPMNPSVTFDACDTNEKLCTASIILSKQWRGWQPDEKLTRYYIPEAQAKSLEQKLRSDAYEFSVGVVPQSNGKAQLKMLYVNGQRLPDFLADNP